jgi:hypothetical protein
MISASVSSRVSSKPSRKPGNAGLAFLALAPAEQVVGGATGQILDRLDVVLAELHQHGGDARHLLERILDTKLLALGVELGSPSRGTRGRASATRARYPRRSLDASDLLSSTMASSRPRLPSEASSWPTTSSTLSASMNSLVRFELAWRCSDLPAR